MKRISVEIDDELHEDLLEHVPHGFRKHVLGMTIRIVVDAVRDNGKVMIGALMAGDFKIVKNIRADTPHE